MIILGALLALLLGPLIYQLVEKKPVIIKILDGFVFLSIGGLLILHLAVKLRPDNLVMTAVLLAAGFIGPTLVERSFKKAHQRIHGGAILLAFIGLLLHAGIDGAALIPEIHDHHHEHLSLPLAIIFHRLPVGLMLWWLISPHYGKWWGWLGIVLMCAATVAGVYAAEEVLVLGQGYLLHYVQAFVSGAILHVVIFPFHLEHGTEVTGASCCSHQESESPEKSCCHPGSSSPEDKNYHAAPEFFGNLIAVVMLYLVVSYHGEIPAASSQIIKNISDAFISLAYISAPALIIAYLLSGLIQALVSPASLKWLAKGSLSVQALKGLVLGLPLPVCSCGILPFYRTIVKKGAAPAAAIAFLIATPELGIDAILISFPLLGIKLTLLRLLGAIALAFVVARILAPGVKPLPLKDEHAASKSFMERLKEGLKFGTGELVDTTGPWILAGIALAAVLHPLLKEYPININPFIQVPVFGLLGIVVYVCASGATPLVAVLLFGGLSPGAAIAFLLTGPATNVSTFGVLSELHGRRFAVIFGVTAALTAVIIGLIVDLFFPDLKAAVLPEAAHSHVEFYRTVAVWAVSILFLLSIVRRGARAFFGEIFSGNIKD
ncbi:MAG: hypothetical protein D6719_11450 [Candidatus Dadabacteria bacterium]|nr:MAG: hypothetical protein D6719_11450 [Candidatus Dadabacteria bacterium]